MKVGLLSLAMILNVSAVLGYLWFLGRVKSPQSKSPNPPNLEEMKRHILWHSFYVNPNDYRGWVPKTFGYGWTVNFRSKRNVLIFLALIIGVVFISVELVASVQRQIGMH